MESKRSTPDVTPDEASSSGTDWAPAPSGTAIDSDALHTRPDAPSRVPKEPTLATDMTRQSVADDPLSRPNTFPNTTYPSREVVQSESPGAPIESVAFPSTAVVAGSKGRFTRRQRRLIVALTSLLLVLGLTGSIFYFVYNKPETVVADSFMKLATANSSTIQANATVHADNTTAVLQVRTDTSSGSQGMAIVDGSLKSGDTNLPLKLSFAVDKEDTLFFKVDKTRQILDTFKRTLADSGADSTRAAAAMEAFAQSIDGQWISVSDDDIETLTGQRQDDQASKCVEEQLTSFRSAKSQQEEVRQAYDKNKFVVVEQRGLEQIDGVYANHYRLKQDQAKARSFMLAMRDTQLFKNIDNCTDVDLAGVVKDSADDIKSSVDTPSSSALTITTDYWVSIIGHEPLRSTIDIREGTKTALFDIRYKLNNNPTITIPNADKSILDLRREIEQITEQSVPTSRSTSP